ncbi:MAG TPA: hypothetical protein VIC28_10450 [Thermoanaerobaculia bacterium]
MKQTPALMISMLLLASHAWAAGPGPSAAPGARPPAAAAQRAPIEQRLEKLAVAFAGALEERDFRELLQRSLAASKSGDGARLRDLVDPKAAPDGAALGRRLAESLGLGRGEKAGSAGSEARDEILLFLQDTPDVDVSLLPDLGAWDVETETPLTSYVWEGAGGESRAVLTAFDAAGARHQVDPRQPPAPVVLLEVHDTRRAVEILSRNHPDAPASGTANATEKLYGECVDSVSYSSYPLITGAGIWDIHESSLDGPEGFAYFVAAGSEKTGNLPATLGGLSGWSTNVWASNFQGPVPVGGNARVQWEWTADGWLQEAPYRTYPAYYCQQNVSTPASFAFTAYAIKEDDDWGNPDDPVGQVLIDHRYCKSEVFDAGLASGWTAQHQTPGWDDVVYTRYKLYCSTNRNCSATAQCPDGTFVSCWSGGSCAEGNCESGEEYVRCGSYYQYCSSEPSCPHGQIICDPA